MSLYERVRVEDLTLYAINTGEWYATHCELIRSKAPLSAWVRHVKGTVWRNYLRAFPNMLAPNDVIETTARELADYYHDHIQETERSSQ